MRKNPRNQLFVDLVVFFGALHFEQELVVGAKQIGNIVFVGHKVAPLAPQIMVVEPRATIIKDTV